MASSAEAAVAGCAGKDLARPREYPISQRSASLRRPGCSDPAAPWKTSGMADDEATKMMVASLREQIVERVKGQQQLVVLSAAVAGATISFASDVLSGIRRSWLYWACFMSDCVWPSYA